MLVVHCVYTASDMNSALVATDHVNWRWCIITAQLSFDRIILLHVLDARRRHICLIEAVVCIDFSVEAMFKFC